MNFVEPFFSGLFVGAGLIIAIGAQNAYVLKQGIAGRYLFMTALVCSLLDAIFITIGVLGFGYIFGSYSLAVQILKWLGISYLVILAIFSFKDLFVSKALVLNDISNNDSLSLALIQLLLISLLNPQLYLDTMVLLGGIGVQYPEDARIYFISGATIASFVWFFSLTYFAHALSGFLRKPVTWRLLNGIIGTLLLFVAYSLLDE